MRSFLDENMSPVVGAMLGTAFRPHDFVGAHAAGLSGMEDVPLFPLVRERGFDLFITSDQAQMRTPEEREACRAAGLHWVGVRQSKAQGLEQIAFYGGALVSALPGLVDTAGASTIPLLFNVRGPGRELSQLFKYRPL